MEAAGLDEHHAGGRLIRNGRNLCHVLRAGQCAARCSSHTKGEGACGSGLTRLRAPCTTAVAYRTQQQRARAVSAHEYAPPRSRSPPAADSSHFSPPLRARMSLPRSPSVTGGWEACSRCWSIWRCAAAPILQPSPISCAEAPPPPRWLSHAEPTRPRPAAFSLPPPPLSCCYR
jgi:hypothetical protein